MASRRDKRNTMRRGRGRGKGSGSPSGNGSPSGSGSPRGSGSPSGSGNGNGSRNGRGSGSGGHSWRKPKGKPKGKEPQRGPVSTPNEKRKPEYQHHTDGDWDTEEQETEDREEELARMRHMDALEMKVRDILNDPYSSPEEKAEWFRKTIAERDEDVHGLKKQVEDLEWNNDDLRAILERMEDSHTEHIEAEIKDLKQALSKAVRSSREREIYVRTAEQDNEDLRQASKRQQEFLSFLRTGEASLREQIRRRNNIVKFLEQRLATAQKTVEAYRARVESPESTGEYLERDVALYLEALREQEELRGRRTSMLTGVLNWGLILDLEHWRALDQTDQMLRRAGIRRETMPRGRRSRARQHLPMDMSDDDNDVDMTNADRSFRRSRSTQKSLVLRYLSKKHRLPKARSPTRSRSRAEAAHNAINSYLPPSSRIVADPFQTSGARRIAGARRTELKRRLLVARKRPRLSRKREEEPEKAEEAESDSAQPTKRARHHLHTPRDRHNDLELAKLMDKMAIENPSQTNGVQTDIPPEAKIVTVTQPVKKVLPRKTAWKDPVFLPKKEHNSPTRLSSSVQQTQRWNTPPRRWTFGPGLGKRPERELLDPPPQGTFLPPPKTNVGPIDNKRTVRGESTWKTWLILVLGLWVLLSTMKRPENHKQDWLEVNEQPDDILAKMRRLEASEGRTAMVVDFEAARWTDVDASVLG